MTVEYKLVNGACIPQRVHTVVISVQHSEDISLEEMQRQLKDVLIKVGEAWVMIKACIIFQRQITCDCLHMLDKRIVISVNVLVFN